MTSKLNLIAHEPILVAALATAITWVAAKYGAKVDPQQASEAAGIVLLIAGAFARQLVRPTAKDPALLPLLPLLPLIEQQDQLAAPLAGNIQVRDPVAKQTAPPPAG